MTILCTGMLFDCLRRPHLFPITLLISSLVPVTDRFGGVMQNMLTVFVFQK